MHIYILKICALTPSVLAAMLIRCAASALYIVLKKNRVVALNNKALILFMHICTHMSASDRKIKSLKKHYNNIYG